MIDATLDPRLSQGSLEECLTAALSSFGGDLRIACSFGVEDMVVLHEAARVAQTLGVVPRIFMLDTGRLHQETYDLVDRARDRYRVDVDIVFPEAAGVEAMVRTKGPNSFYESVANRQECCDLRKVKPLARALRGARAWMTGLRREQSPGRANIDQAMHDDAHGGILKLSPLAGWTTEAVWAFVREHHVPVHALHARGYPSIGCAPCTRAVADGEDMRSGRWWWEHDGHKECGLHPRRGG